MTVSIWSRRASEMLEHWPETYRLTMLLRHRNSPFVRRLVTSRHDIVIEGFPRSANSFAHRAFMFANGWRDPRVATHVHSPTQIVLGARWKVPVLMLIREPADAIVGWLAFAHQFGRLDLQKLDQSARRRWVDYQTRRYVRFYETANHHAASLVLSRFEDTISNFGAVIARVNARFETDFDLFVHTEENVARIFDDSAAHLSPDMKRRALKAELAELYQAPQNARGRERAEAVYLKALELAGLDVSALGKAG